MASNKKKFFKDDSTRRNSIKTEDKSEINNEGNNKNKSESKLNAEQENSTFRKEKIR